MTGRLNVKAIILCLSGVGPKYFTKEGMKHMKKGKWANFFLEGLYHLFITK